MTRLGQRCNDQHRHSHGWLAPFALVVAGAIWCSAARSDEPPLELPPLRPVIDLETTTAPLRVPLPPKVVSFQRDPKSLREDALPVPEAVRSGAPQVPISLDAVLRLAQDRNGQVRLAREKLHEAFIEQDLAAKRWLPDISVGAGYWRHEGGIQDFDGRLLRSSYGTGLGGLDLAGKFDVREVIFRRLEAERKVSHQQGELSKLTSEQLLDAATTYLDLLAARSAEAIARDAERQLQRLLEHTRSLEKVDPGVRVEATRVESELGAQTILTRRLREGASAAAAKLIYLLGLDAASELVPFEKQLALIKLVDADQPVGTLIEQALRRGPGVQDLEAILSLLEAMRARAESPVNFLPTMHMNLTEGAFAAGPGGRLDWDNRWDFGLQARWNLTELVGSRQRRRLLDSRVQQAQLGHADLRGKLTLGVQEASEAARSAREQMTMASKQIKHSEESYNLSDMRLRENIKGRSPSEVLLAVRTLAGARLGYLHALRDHNKAQVRLLVLTGGVACAPE